MGTRNVAESTRNRICAELAKQTLTASQMAPTFGKTVFAMGRLLKILCEQQYIINNGTRASPRGKAQKVYALPGTPPEPPMILKCRDRKKLIKEKRKSPDINAVKYIELPRTVYDPVSGITRHYSGVQHG